MGKQTFCGSEVKPVVDRRASPHAENASETLGAYCRADSSKSNVNGNSDWSKRLDDMLGDESSNVPKEGSVVNRFPVPEHGASKSAAITAKQPDVASSLANRLTNQDRLSNQVEAGATQPTNGANRGGRAINANAWAPAGIPATARKPFINPGAVSAPTSNRGNNAEMDINPLRRLRDSQPAAVRPMARQTGDENSQAATRNINVNTSFFDKLKEQQEQQQQRM